MRADAAKTIESFGILWAETKCVLKCFFRGSDFIYAQLRGAKFEQCIERICAAEGIGDEFGFCGVVFLLLEIKAAEVVMSFAEIVINEEGASIGLFGFAGLVGVMISEAEVIPCLGIGGNKCGGEFEFFNGLRVFAFVDEFFALNKGFGARGSAAGYEEKQNEREVK